MLPSILQTALRDIFRDLGRTARILFVPAIFCFAAFLGLCVWLPQTMSVDLVDFLTGIPLSIMGLWIAVSWHRYALADLAKPLSRFGFIGRCGFYLLVGIVICLAVFICSIPFQMLAKAAFFEADSVVLTAFAIAISALCLGMIGLRLAILLPAVALGPTTDSFRMMWRRTKKMWLPLCGIVLIMGLGFGLVTGGILGTDVLLDLVFTPSSLPWDIARATVEIFAQLLITLGWVALLSSLYRHVYDRNS
ncbi:hypothetical protein [Thioclava sp. GXIMD4215]|uniref:hypothetical protein n=1 Tax=Thioclava sp. GXIMD4215 TaxID=3131928 RepID=UPI00325360C6